MRATLVILGVLVLANGVAWAQPSGELGSDRETLTAPKAKDGFFGPRKDLASLTPAEQATLAKLIDAYTSANKNAVVKVHESTMMNPKLHDVHKAPYTQLFSWHHKYLDGLDAYLKANNFPYVPCPKWNPNTPIPKVFGYHNGKKVIQNFDPKENWSAFLHSKLLGFTEDVTKGPDDKTPDKDILANTLVVIHNDTHNTVGGIMASMSSPTAPIFWCFHGFIDDIWTDWKDVDAHRPKGPPTLELGPQVRSFEAQVHVMNGKVMLMAGGEMLTVANEPFVSILKSVANGSVFVTVKATPGSDHVEVLSVTAEGGMSNTPIRDAAGPKGKKIGQVEAMMEAKVVGEQGDFFVVQVDRHGKTGFVPKAAIVIAHDATVGIMGHLHHP